MALLGNLSVLHKSPAKYTTGTVGYGDRANWNKPGMMRSRGNTTVSTLWKYDAVPSGMFAGRAFFPPQTAGRIVSRNSLSVAAAASGAMGKPGSASASLAVNASAVGGLIAGGVATCTITINAAASIAGLAAGRATASMAINASAAISATAWGVANGAFSITATAQGYGLGYMQASTVDTTTLSPATITQAVWRANAADYADTGTMGAKLNAASSGGVDLNALAAAVWAYASRTLTGSTTALTPTQAAQLAEVWALHGLDPAAPLAVTETSRTAGTVAQTLATTAGTTTVTRTA